MIPDSNALSAAKATHKKAVKAIEAAKLTIILEGAKAFELYRCLHSDEARQPWEKIIKAQVTSSP